MNSSGNSTSSCGTQTFAGSTSHTPTQTAIGSPTSQAIQQAIQPAQRLPQGQRASTVPSVVPANTSLATLAQQRSVVTPTTSAAPRAETAKVSQPAVTPQQSAAKVASTQKPQESVAKSAKSSDAMEKVKGAATSTVKTNTSDRGTDLSDAVKKINESLKKLSTGVDSAGQTLTRSLLALSREMSSAALGISNAAKSMPSGPAAPASRPGSRPTPAAGGAGGLGLAAVGAGIAGYSALSGVARAGGGLSLAQVVQNTPTFGQGFEGIGVIESRGNMLADAELALMQAQAMSGVNLMVSEDAALTLPKTISAQQAAARAEARRKSGKMPEQRGGRGFTQSNVKITGDTDTFARELGMSIPQAAQVLSSVSAAYGGQLTKEDQALVRRLIAAGESPQAIFGAVGSQRAMIGEGDFLELNLARQQGLRGTQAQAYQSTLQGLYASQTAANIGTNRRTLYGTVQQLGQGNLTRGAAIFGRGQAANMSVGQNITAGYQGVGQSLLMASYMTEAGGDQFEATRLMEEDAAAGGTGMMRRLLAQGVPRSEARKMMLSMGLRTGDVLALERGGATARGETTKIEGLPTGRLAADSAAVSRAAATNQRLRAADTVTQRQSFRDVQGLNVRVEENAITELQTSITRVGTNFTELVNEINTVRQTFMQLNNAMQSTTLAAAKTLNDPNAGTLNKISAAVQLTVSSLIGR